MKDILLEIFYILSGIVSIIAAVYAYKNKKDCLRLGTAAFWGIFGIIFIIGRWIPSYIVGILILIMGLISALNKVGYGKLINSEENFRLKAAAKLKNKIFIPALTIGIVAFLVTFLFKWLGGIVGLGIGSVLATIIAFPLIKAKPEEFTYDGSRLLLCVGTASILPQLLAALGSLFNKAGVGEVISSGISGIIVKGDIFAGVVAYCVGMAIFTMIMGNAFAAFTVITAGIGMPFVYSQGANPAIAGMLALTAGYCGTLLTPMAANFNVVPAALLGTKNKNEVIIAQAPVAIALLISHIILMYFWAF